jgi:hypothetical protein
MLFLTLTYLISKFTAQSSNCFSTLSKASSQSTTTATASTDDKETNGLYGKLDELQHQWSTQQAESAVPPTAVDSSYDTDASSISFGTTGAVSVCSSSNGESTGKLSVYERLYKSKPTIRVRTSSPLSPSHALARRLCYQPPKSALPKPAKQTSAKTTTGKFSGGSASVFDRLYRTNTKSKRRNSQK